jgi:glycosyltransferase involved in cell wall biosynthesis
VAVHAGARDDYQLALALHEGGLLERLVTNVYSSRTCRARYGFAFPSKKLSIPLRSFLAFCAMRSVRGLDLTAISDAVLSEAARRIAKRKKCAVFACSYYARQAFDPNRTPLPYRFLFQLHPHPKSIRRILTDELERTPIAKSSLMAEKELHLTGRSFEALASEPRLANGIVSQSSFNASTLVENGIPADFIRLVPLGVDRSRFPVRAAAPANNEPFTIIWVGVLSQRKGLTYFLDAVRMLQSRNVRVRIRGHRGSGGDILDAYSDLELDVRYSESTASVVRDLQRSDVYVLPSLLEGFGRTIIEAMSCGVPVITTPNTCGPDVMEDGREGFIIPIRDSEALAAKLEWAVSNRRDLAEMGVAAGKAADKFTWPAFRQGIRNAYKAMLVGAHGPEYPQIENT